MQFKFCSDYIEINLKLQLNFIIPLSIRVNDKVTFVDAVNELLTVLFFIF